MMIPSLQSNFLQIPELFIEQLIASSMTRNELLVCLCLARRTFALGLSKALVPIEELVQASKLPQDAVQEAILRSIDRGLILRFEVEGSGPPVLFALNTEENALLAGYEEPSITRTAAPAPSSLPAHVTLPPSGLVQDRIVQLLGRALTKDEQARLNSLNASDADLLQAITSLEERKTKIYSSDQVVYECEALQMHRRQAPVNQRSRSSTCPKCGGTGYLFLKQKSLKVCECKR